ILSATTGVAALSGATSSKVNAATAAGASCSTPRSAIAKTQYGKVRGYIDDGVLTFKGVPYGANTGGENRWLPAKPPKSWDGEYPALIYGANCPQRLHTWTSEQTFLFQWTDGWQSEDMLKLNIWTSSLSGKRPVMVYLHGGGFTFGSAYELASQDGAQMARHHDVVSVTVNHRLNVLGFLDVTSIGGPAYADSVNVGMTDLVAALRWVRDNIANFGGDPGNVMIFGQSGGGGKVNTLMAMPAAKGLFHRAAVESGSLMDAATADDSAKLGAAVLQQLGISPSQIDQIKDVPVDRLVGAGIAAIKSLATPMQLGRSFSLPRIGWQPMVDGTNLPAQPWDPAAPALSANVPLLVGTVLNEFSNALYDPSLSSMTDDQLKARVATTYKDQAAHIIDVFRAANPKATPGQLMSLISAAPVRQGAITQAERKAAQGAAPAFNYWFTWQTPVLDGRPGAFHCSELSFVFDNTDRCAPMTGGGPGPRALAAKVSDAWINFARHGDPNHSGLPHWPAFTAAECPTMIFDTECVMKNDPDGAERASLRQA
ncbi:MAG TPA: carboxylesterase family protein, partial [Candidatus Baltobacteraceae bacterium]|nr:carboxylesterase family protein [Candidatus Baltobacteraceae bacterium]